MRIIIGLVLVLYFLFHAAPVLHAQRVVPSVVVPPVIEDGNNIETEAYRSGRGSYRSPRGGYIDGNRSGVNPGYGTDRTGRRPGVNDPINRTPGAPTGRFGSFFGGLAAGTLLGSLLNPFGFGGNGGFSLIGLLFWAVILYLAYRMLRRLFGSTR